MNSEQMRVELERFVNQGLQEGWCGWPRHENGSFHRTDGAGGTNRTCRVAQRSDCPDGSHMSYWSCTSN